MTLVQLLLEDLAKDPEGLEELRGLLDTAAAERMVKPPEAADFLGIHYKTLVRAAAKGRVRGAYRIGAHRWGFRLSELELLPPEPLDLGPAGPGRGIRRPGASSATLAIRGTTTARRAA